MHKAAQALFRAEDAMDLVSNPGLQEGLGGRLAALPASLGAHGHDGIGELQKMTLARAVGADDDVETSGEGQIGLLEDREIPDPERLKHQLDLPPLKRTQAKYCMGESWSGGVSTVEPVGFLKPSLATRWLEGWKRRIISA